MAYRDAKLEMEKLLSADEFADIFTTAKDDAIATFAPTFKAHGDSLVNAEGVSIEEWTKALRESKPHFFPPDTGDLIDRAKAGSLTAVSALYKQLGKQRFEEVMRQHGFSNPYDPRSAPKPGATGKKPFDPERAKNPWSAAGWNITRQGACVRSMGLARAQSIAKSCGCVVGSTKPNPAFN
ncbi:hypothetical protein [Bradyrhizobium genosp. P]|uniref:hypothetical protein n=1 Tax=Bradyrhizobium genosp. P TaxID=83641 RepID=UPI003CEBAF75